jgi:16S rRNA (cytosine1402-N4)-methyltransferase
MTATPRHEPVMPAEVVAVLMPARGGLFVDCTAGLGGHGLLLLEAGAGRLLGLDRDAEALRIAAERLRAYGDRVELVHSDYRELGQVLEARAIPAVDGVLADLGVSSMQLEAEGRGFTFRRDEPLDMRMDRSRGPTVAELLLDVQAEDLANLIFQFGEERHSRRIARAIVRRRDAGPIASTVELAELVRRAVPARGYQRIDPATRTFQALRIWVNRELEGLDAFLQDAARRLLAGARLAVITFHSLEDRIVKHTFRAIAAAGDAWRVLTRKPIIPADEEVARNPRSRSAKLRAIERLA